MPERRLIEPIIQGISAHAAREGATTVMKVWLMVGEASGLREEPLRTAFSDLARGTLLEQAELQLSFLPGTEIGVHSFDID